MITDELSNLKLYASLHPGIAHVIDFLNEHDLALLPEGKTTLPIEGAFVNVQTVSLKQKEEAKLESHRKMIDVQIPITGSETMGYIPVEKAATASYNEEKDITFHPSSPDSYIRVHKGMFAIFMPGDAHQPCVGESAIIIKKAVFKLPLQSK